MLMKDPSLWETVEDKAQGRTSKKKKKKKKKKKIITKYLKCYKRENMLRKKLTLAYKFK